MKKLLLTLLSFIFCLILSAQGDPTRGENIEVSNDDFLRAGRWYAGGMLAFTGTSDKHEDSSGEEKGPKQSNITILPEFGYVLNDKYAVVLAMGWASSTSTTYEFNSSTGDDWELKDKSNMFLFMPMVKMYSKISNRLYCMPSLDITLGFGSNSNEIVGFNEETFEEEIQSLDFNESLFGIGLRAGLKYFPAENWAISFSYGSLYYNTSTSKGEEDSDIKWTTNSYGLDLNLSSVRVGAYYFFK